MPFSAWFETKASAWADARSKLPKPAEDAIRSATPEELTAQAQPLGTYTDKFGDVRWVGTGESVKPWPRQAVAFMPQDSDPAELPTQKSDFEMTAQEASEFYHVPIPSEQAMICPKCHHHHEDTPNCYRPQKSYFRAVMDHLRDEEEANLNLPPEGLPPTNSTPPCPTCKAPVFVRPNGNIVAHYNGDGDRCSANETRYQPQPLGNETKSVSDLLNSMKVIDRHQRYQECRSDVLTNLMYELAEFRENKRLLSPSAAVPVEERTADEIAIEFAEAMLKNLRHNVAAERERRERLIPEERTAEMQWRELTREEIIWRDLPARVRCVDCKGEGMFHRATCKDVSRYEVPTGAGEQKDAEIARLRAIVAVHAECLPHGVQIELHDKWLESRKPAAEPVSVAPAPRHEICQCGKPLMPREHVMEDDDWNCRNRVVQAQPVPEERTAEMEREVWVKHREYIASEVRKHYDESPQEIASFICFMKAPVKSNSDHIEPKPILSTESIQEVKEC
jgi:hypothetical protein